MGLSGCRTADSENFIDTSPGVCIFLSHLQELHCAFSAGDGLRLPSPLFSQQLLLNSVNKAGLLYIWSPPFSQWPPIVLTWSLGHKDFGERWGNYAEIDLRRPLPHTPMAAAPGPASSSGVCYPLGGRGSAPVSGASKKFVSNADGNQSPYHCCLYKPLNILLLCGETLRNALSSFLIFFPPRSCVCMMLISYLLVSSCSFVYLRFLYLPLPFISGYLGGFFFFFFFLPFVQRLVSM